MNGFQIGGLCLEISTRSRRHLTPRLTAFYRVVVYLYYLYSFLALRVKSDRLKAMLWHDVVLWENSKAVGWCGGGGVVCRVVWCGVDSLRDNN